MYKISTPKKDLLKILVKPTHSCNLNCSYCYDKAHKSKEIMPLERIEQVAKFASESANNIIWIWHGGEPMLPGLKYHREAVKILKKYNIETISMQTNATLINEEWANFFNKWDYNVSSSFDGLTNSETRQKTNEILAGMETYYKVTGKKMSIIQVITEESLSTFSDNYAYFKELDFIKGWQWMRAFESASTLQVSLEKKEIYLEEYAKLLDIWLKDEEPLYLRNFDEWFRNIIGASRHLCSYGGKCLEEWINVEPNGKLTVCDRWFPEEYYLGHIDDYNNYSDLVEHSKVHQKLKEITKKRKQWCKDSGCEIYDFCNGGCLATSLVSSDGVTPDETMCEYRRAEFFHLYNKISNMKPSEIKNPDFRKELLRQGFRDNKTINEIINN